MDSASAADALEQLPLHGRAKQRSGQRPRQGQTKIRQTDRPDKDPLAVFINKDGEKNGAGNYRLGADKQAPGVSERPAGAHHGDVPILSNNCTAKAGRRVTMPASNPRTAATTLTRNQKDHCSPPRTDAEGFVCTSPCRVSALFNPVCESPISRHDHVIRPAT